MIVGLTLPPHLEVANSTARLLYLDAPSRKAAVVHYNMLSHTFMRTYSSANKEQLSRDAMQNLASSPGGREGGGAAISLL